MHPITRLLATGVLAASLSLPAATAQTAPPEPPLEGRFIDILMSRDANKDGLIQREEVINQRARAFDRADKDKNGVLSGAEYQTIKRRERGEGRAFDAVDANSDGGVTRAEFNERDLRAFNKTDADKDGTLTSAEIDAAREDIRLRAGARPRG